MSANDPAREPAGHGLASTSRRRALLKGLGKAGALAGAAMPLQPLLAADKPPMRMTKTNNKTYLCSVSGNMSLLHSGVNVSTTCGGKKRSHYQVCTGSGANRVFTNWPAGCPVATTAFNTVFLAGPSTSLGDLVMASSAPAETTWVVALLNSYKKTSTYPYSAAELKTLYRQELANGSSTARTFLTTYLETEA